MELLSRQPANYPKSIDFRRILVDPGTATPNFISVCSAFSVPQGGGHVQPVGQAPF